MDSPTYLSPQSNLATLIPSLHWMNTHQQITNFHATHNKFCAIVGLSTPLAVATLHPPSCHDPYHSASNLHAINMTLVAPSSGNLQHARRSSKMAKISSITSAPLTIVLKYTATSSILFAFETVTQLHISGSSKHQLLLNFVQFAPFRWLSLSSSLTMMADAPNHSQPPSNQLAGVSPQPTPPSRPMAIHLRLVSSHHWHPFFVRTNGQTALPQITSTVYPTPSRLINLGAIQSTGTFCVASKRR